MIQALSRGLILAVGFVFFATVAQAQQYATVVMDARTGKIVHAVNADTRVHPASLTKMMTLYIVFDEVRRGRLSLDQKVTISKNAANEPPSRLGLRAGQRIELRYLIRAAAIKSANDAATALGEAVSGSEEAFARRMNAYARAMGLRNTSFQNAHGLTASGHISSARDMAIIGRRLIYDFPQYYNIFGRNSTSAGIATVKNTNRRLLDAYPGADGIKTGYTRAAGFNLVSSAQRGQKRVIVALMGGKTSASRNAEVARLMDLGFSKMPARVQVATLPPLGITVASAEASRGSTAALAASAGLERGAEVALVASGRPMPRTLGSGVIARSTQSIAAAIAEVNAELAATVSAQAAATQPADGPLRPLPRPGASAPATVATASLGSTFAAAPARQEPPDEGSDSIQVASGGAGTTGGNDWGVQLGAFRAKGDAERRLLTTALKDVPELAGGLRRVEPAKVQGVTVYRAQFVGLSQADAQAACAALVRQSTDCLPLAPGI
jgi:D-alanyl-D-alanine carboxypeptidase